MKDIYESIAAFLPPVFNLDPVSERSIHISSAQNIQEVELKNYILQIWLNYESYREIRIDLREKTIQDVVDLINASDNLIAELISGGTASAMRLVKPINDWDDAEIIVDDETYAGITFSSEEGIVLGDGEGATIGDLKKKIINKSVL